MPFGKRLGMASQNFLVRINDLDDRLCFNLEGLCKGHLRGPCFTNLAHLVCLTVMESDAGPRNPAMDIYLPRSGQWSACILAARAA